jgi:hypothetical protein
MLRERLISPPEIFLAEPVPPDQRDFTPSLLGNLLARLRRCSPFQTAISECAECRRKAGSGGRRACFSTASMIPPDYLWRARLRFPAREPDNPELPERNHHQAVRRCESFVPTEVAGARVRGLTSQTCRQRLRR